MRFVRASESADRCKSAPRKDAGVGKRIERVIEGRREREKRLSPFFLFGVAIERGGDQVVNTCSASKHGSPTYFSNDRTRDGMVFLVGLLESA